MKSQAKSNTDTCRRTTRASKVVLAVDFNTDIRKRPAGALLLLYYVEGQAKTNVHTHGRYGAGKLLLI